MDEGHVFVCHSSLDAGLATRLAAVIESVGKRCWIAPRDVESGVPYPRQLVKAIDTCRTFLLLVTANSCASDHVLREVEQAAKRGRTILPVVVDGAMSDDLDYFVGAVHQIVGNADAVCGQVERYFVRSDAPSAPSEPPPRPARRLKVGVIPFPPFSSHPTTTGGQPGGLYTALLNRYASENGMQAEYEAITNDKTIRYLESGRIDVVSCLYRSPRRAAKYDFAASFYASSVTAVVRRDGDRVRMQRDLKDESVTIAACRGEIGSEIAQDSFGAERGSTRLVEVDTVDVKAIAAMVAMGLADVAITDTVTCKLIVDSSPIPLKELFTQRPLFVGHIGLMLDRRNGELARDLDRELTRIRRDPAMLALEQSLMVDYPDLVEPL